MSEAAQARSFETGEELRSQATLWPKGNKYEDMEVGRVFEHHWGRTITEADNVAFTAQTLSFCPLYFNRPYAESMGHRDMVVNPLLVFNTAFGMSVEDLSEGGGPFLGVEQCEFLKTVYVGDTITARSKVVNCRESKGQPGMGIVTWHTEGFNQRGEKVVSFMRTNLVRKRG